MNRDQWNARYNEKERLWQPTPHPTLRSTAEALPAGRALDLAAGEGRNAVYLAQAGWDVTAVDFADVAVERGRELTAGLGLSVNWQVADLLAYEPDRARFDLVCVCFLHMPWREMQEVLVRAATATRPGGTFLVLGHDLANLTHGVGGPQDAAVLYTPADVVPLLEGFEITRAEQAINPVDHGPEEGAQIDCVVIAVKD